MSVVLATIDCLRNDRLGFMGYEGGTSPFLDELAEESTVFDNTFATGPATTYSMPGLMTGTYPSWFGGYPPIADSVTSMAEAFRAEGYTTIGIHSNPWLHRTNRFDTGFSVYEDLSRTQLTGQETEQDIKKGFSVESVQRELFEGLKSVYYNLPNSVQTVVSQGYFSYWYLTGGADDSAETIVQRAIQALDEHGTDDVFLWLHFMDVHRPYTLPPERSLTDIWHTARITRPEYKHPSERDEQYISETYDSAIRYVDCQLERLHAYLTEQRGEDPLFVVTADHGEEFGEHGDWFHREFKMYNELLKVPLLMNYPAGEGHHVDELTSLVDVAPTLLEYADIDVPPSMAGESLLSVLQTGADPTREVAFSEVYDPERDTIAITTKRWKYIHDRPNGVRRLYDLGSDPEERTDLLPESTVPDELRQHEHWYTERMERSTDQKMDQGVQTRLRELGYLE